MNDLERTLFSKFLRSPFYNQQKELHALYRILLKKLPNYTGSPTGKNHDPKAIFLIVDEVFPTIYPLEIQLKDSYQQKTKIHNLCSDLNLAFEDFVAAKSLKEDKIRKYYLYLDYLRNKENESLWRTGLRKFSNAIDEHGDSVYTRHYRYLYHKLEFESPFFDRTQKQHATAKLQEVFNAENNFHLLTRLTQACEFVFRPQVIDEGTPGNFNKAYLEALLQEVFPLANEAHPLIHSYYATIQLKVRDGDLKEFSKTADLLRIYHSRIDGDELNDLVRYLLNFCTFKSNRGNKAFLTHRLLLEQWAIESGLLLEDGLVPDAIFLNAGLNAIGLKRFDLAEEYIRKYGPKLDKSVKRSAVSLVKAYLYFFQEQYTKAKQELEKVTLQRHNYSIRKYLLLLRTVYHAFLDPKGATDAYKMLHVLDNFKRFCHRNNYHIPADRKKSYLNLERLMRKMVDYQSNPHKKNSRQLQRIETDFKRQPLALRNWIAPFVIKLLENDSDAAD